MKLSMKLCAILRGFRYLQEVLDKILILDVLNHHK